MIAIYELYASAYLPAAGIGRRPRPGERLGDLTSDGELPATRDAPEEPRRRGAIRAFVQRLVRETTAACLWRHGQDAQL